MKTVFLLLVIYQMKHFLADFPLQGRYMLGKFGFWPKWVFPLTAHAAVHGLMTYVIAYCVNPNIALWLALFDFFTHFIVDRLKANPTLGGRYKPMDKAQMERVLGIFAQAKKYRYNPNSPMAEEVKNANYQTKANTYFWWLLGLDQMAHHLTHYFIIWKLIN
jgi:hypothetical protein